MTDTNGPQLPSIGPALWGLLNALMVVFTVLAVLAAIFFFLIVFILADFKGPAGVGRTNDIRMGLTFGSGAVAAAFLCELFRRTFVREQRS